MTAPTASAYSPADDPQRHNRVLLHAWQATHPVLYCGRQRFIQGLRFMTEGSALDAAVYLTGNPQPVPAVEVTLFTRPESHEPQTD
ncbi:MAG: hypothetical protein K2X55_01135 [Burkholderiaceae bacterium]|nr:hypothetical protein [Burkholderiaceae bacterium]